MAFLYIPLNVNPLVRWEGLCDFWLIIISDMRIFECWRGGSIENLKNWTLTHKKKTVEQNRIESESRRVAGEFTPANLWAIEVFILRFPQISGSIISVHPYEIPFGSIISVQRFYVLEEEETKLLRGGGGGHGGGGDSKRSEGGEQIMERCIRGFGHYVYSCHLWSSSGLFLVFVMIHAVSVLWKSN